MSKKITKESTLKELLGMPGAEEILVRHGVPCMSCPYASLELEQLKIGEVCEMYGLDVEKILKDLSGKSDKKNNSKN